MLFICLLMSTFASATNFSISATIRCPLILLRNSSSSVTTLKIKKVLFHILLCIILSMLFCFLKKVLFHILFVLYLLSYFFPERENQITIFIIFKLSHIYPQLCTIGNSSYRCENVNIYA